MKCAVKPLAMPVIALVMLAVPPAVAQTRRCEHLPAVVAPAAVPNDNRVTSGTLADGVLTLFLVAERASWWPDGPDGCALQVNAFAEEGKPAQIPGPLVRVAAGTEVLARIRNALPDTIWLRALHDRDGRIIEQVTVAPGGVREVSYTAREPGTFFYWGAFAPNGPGWTASNEFGTLVGALLVDPPGSSVDDRIFLLTRWTNSRGTTRTGFELNAINGLSWPHTERLTLTQETAVRWRVINASNSAHAMHLHGFYFLVTSSGLPRRDTTFTQNQRQRSVTEFMNPGRSL
jgi:FtsP/CotA-like multicopper oxidase with cupredoxin domain